MAGAYGTVGPLRQLNTYPCLPAGFSISTVQLDNYTTVGSAYRGDFNNVNASGRSPDDLSHSQLLAVSEGLERYASVVVDETAQITATAVELGAQAMDLDTVARCSGRELRHPDCPLRLPDKNLPIRWNEAVDLHSGRDVFVPSVMTHISAPNPLPGELFWHRISTGVATHTSVEAATLNAICELIERDALALTWLQRLPLPRLAPGCVTPGGQRVVDWCDRHGIDTHLFDATTDVGVPTVYCVQTVRDPRAGRPAQYIGCATEFDPGDAAEHALLEAAGIPIVMIDRGQLPQRYADFTRVTDGAAQMGRPSHRPAFGFLLDAPSERRVSAPAAPAAGPVLRQLEFVLRRLRDLGMSVFAVDISTREVDDAGLYAIRVIIPELQPMSLRPRAQYRAHPRLYRAPAAMGLPVRPESKLNPYPQPLP